MPSSVLSLPKPMLDHLNKQAVPRWSVMFTVRGSRIILSGAKH